VVVIFFFYIPRTVSDYSNVLSHSGRDQDDSLDVVGIFPDVGDAFHTAGHCQCESERDHADRVDIAVVTFLI